MNQKTDTQIPMSDFEAAARAAKVSTMHTMPAIDEPVDDLTVIRHLDGADVLAEPSDGMVQLGTLNTKEAELMYKLSFRLDAIADIQAEIDAGGLTELATLRRERRTIDHGLYESMVTKYKDYFVELHRLQTERDYLSTHLFYLIKTRLGHHDYSLFVCSRRRVMAGERKW